ncbi:hypothetical protein B0T26DRAFT_735220 [Lasiosphaeria miniovina]|uniref:Uncharacterized protein n=1 Tax=Lasiosphaeria miniovina TaxID=1954250 RepID=A0AA39ZQN6_9PEZI|nr:uncharacterized protein B0T26DRAFT_735220 [Lasiosphaeria miniovina]KAK0701920.1 hypothetical protein B0T26DRAFT_735220 [Lasiosphaeria miniovina]
MDHGHVPAQSVRPRTGAGTPDPRPGDPDPPPGSTYRVRIVEMQRMRIQRLQINLTQHARRLSEGTEPDGWEELDTDMRHFGGRINNPHPALFSCLEKHRLTPGTRPYRPLVPPRGGNWWRGFASRVVVATVAPRSSSAPCGS